MKHKKAAKKGQQGIAIPCKFCKRARKIIVAREQIEKWVKGALVQDAFPNMKPELREMFISQTCPKCWEDMFGGMEENPAPKDHVFDDAIRVAEHKFKKPYKKFNEAETKFAHLLYGKADDDRISLKILPDRGDALPDITPDFAALPEDRSQITLSNPEKSEYKWFVVDEKGVPLSGWEYKQDAVDASKDEAVPAKVRHVTQVNRKALATFMKLNELNNPSLGVQDDKPLTLAHSWDELEVDETEDVRTDSLGIEDDQALDDDEEEENVLAANPSQEDDTKRRRAIRSAVRKFKKKEKDFGQREWQYVAKTIEKIKNI